MHVKAQTIPHLYPRIVWGLIAACLLLSLCYGVLVGKAVFAAVSRKAAESQTSIGTAQMSSLETTYLKLAERITPTFALAQGFTVNSKAHFVTSAEAGKALTLNLAR